MAEQLIKIAASRELRETERMVPDPGALDEFASRFPYNETEDQGRAISSVVDDLGKGRPTDRLVCGDVGFGKTEVALRAAFVAVQAGWQVAVHGNGDAAIDDMIAGVAAPTFQPTGRSAMASTMRLWMS